MREDQLSIRGYDAIEFWVGNAKQAAHYHRTGFGFRLVAFAGPETGVRDRVSYVLEQGRVRFVLTSGLSPEHEVVSHHARHGDGVRDVAFDVPDAAEALAVATERGALPLFGPTTHEDEHGKLTIAAIRVYGDTIHSFVQRDGYDGPYRPGYASVPGDGLAAAIGLRSVDHVVANVELGQMDTWAGFYERTLGFAPLRHFTDEEIATRDSALMSKVLWDGVGRIKLPINEPVEGRGRSQVEEFLAYYGGPGVQHLALAADDIVTAVRRMRANGVGFLDVPREYYDEARARVGEVGESWDDLAELGILVDRDDEGYLLQIFTEPIGDRPTLFYEIIQRQGATGFGAGNFRALFEAVERAQRRRGNL